MRKNDIYNLTLKGLISMLVPNKQLEMIMKEIELYCRRHNFNGVVLIDDNKFTNGEFITFRKGVEN